VVDINGYSLNETGQRQITEGNKKAPAGQFQCAEAKMPAATSL
jgi:hypothetical protein